MPFLVLSLPMGGNGRKDDNWSQSCCMGEQSKGDIIGLLPANTDAFDDAITDAYALIRPNNARPSQSGITPLSVHKVVTVVKAMCTA